MVNSFVPLYLTIAGAFLSLAIIVILRIREQKTAISNTKDIFDTYSEYVKSKLAKSKTDVTYKEYIMINIFGPIIGFLASYFALYNVYVSAFVAVLAFFIPDIYVRIMKDKNERNFEKKYLRCLSQLSSSLRSGLSIEQAVEDVCKCSFISDTLKEEFLRLNADLKFKVPLEEAFLRFAERTNSNDAMDVAAALSMQAEVGGNESKVVSDIANNISQRNMIRKEVNALFADTSMTVLVMEIMPVIIVIGIWLYSPKYFDPFFESLSMKLLFIGLWVFMFIGTFVTRKMTKKVKRIQ